jgi:predicted RNA binding protein YcfA (HicA-like mRNA interferase family)
MSKRLPQAKPREVIRALVRAGFEIHHTTGSHHVLKHESGFRVTIAYHNRNLKRGTLASIIRQAGLTVEEFTRLL